MNIIKEDIDELNAVIKLQIVKEDYEKDYNKQINEYRSKTTLKGFRQGKVPKGLIKKMYGKQLLSDAMNKLINTELFKYLKENQLKLVGEPLVNKEQKQIDFVNQSEFEFCYDIGLQPAFDIPLSKDVLIPFYDIAIENELIDQNIKSIAEKDSKEIDIDEITEDASVRGNLSQLDNEGNILKDGISKENVFFAIKYIKDEEEKAKLIGNKKHDTVSFNIRKAFPNDTEISAILAINREIAKDLKSDFQYTISKIFKLEPAEINQELFNKTFGKDVNTEDEFKDKIRDIIEAQYPEAIEQQFKKDTKNYLLKEHDFKLPDEFLKRWLLETNKKLTKENVDKEYEGFKQNLKWQIIKNKIIEEQKIVPDDDDLNEIAKQLILTQVRQKGQNISVEQFELSIQELLKDEKQKAQIVELAKEELVTDYVREQITLEEKEITTKNFALLQ